MIVVVVIVLKVGQAYLAAWEIAWFENQKFYDNQEKIAGRKSELEDPELKGTKNKVDFLLNRTEVEN